MSQVARLSVPITRLLVSPRIVITILLAVAGCTTGIRFPQLGTLYDREAQHHDEHRNPVIVIPGILGSKLVDGATGRIVWVLRSLLQAGRVTGPRVHDARVAALCEVHGVRELWTADRDFSRFAGLATHNPLVG